MPKHYIDRFKQLTIDFIWEYKPAKIKYLTMINKIEHGRLKLQDLETKIKALKLKWIKQILDENYTHGKLIKIVNFHKILQIYRYII
jgi:hypothetical protein